MFNKRMSFHWIQITALCLALTACSGVVGGGAGGGPTGLGVGEQVLSGGGAGGASGATGTDTEGDAGAGQVGGDSSAGQPTQGNAAKPRPGLIGVVVEPDLGMRDPVNQTATHGYTSKLMKAGDVLGDIGSEWEFDDGGSGPFPGGKPMVTLWREGNAEPDSPSKPTDEWGQVQMKYTILTPRNEACIDNFFVQACYTEGGKYYRSEKLYVQCAHEKNSVVTVKLPLRETSFPFPCPL